MKQTRLKKKSKNKKTILLQKAIQIFNTWVRKRDTMKLKGRCYTCSSKGSEAGHFLHDRNSVRFDEINVHLQCTRCNKWLSGNLGEYALRLVDEYGRPAVENLKARAMMIKQFTESELKEIIDTYTSKPLQ